MEDKASEELYRENVLRNPLNWLRMLGALIVLAGITCYFHFSSNHESAYTHSASSSSYVDNVSGYCFSYGMNPGPAKPSDFQTTDSLGNYTQGARASAYCTSLFEYKTKKVNQSLFLVLLGGIVLCFPYPTRVKKNLSSEEL